MQITRRAFGKLASFGLLAFTVGINLVLTGCGWVADVEAIIPSALKALSLLLAMIQNAGITIGGNVQAIVGEINAAAGDVLAALQSGPLTGTVLQEVITALNDFLTYFQNFINFLPPLPATIIDLVAGGIEVILSTIEAYLMNPPAPVPASAVAAHTAALDKLKAFRGMIVKGPGGNDRTIQFTAKKRNNSQFAHDWNAVEPKQYHL